MPSRHTCQHSDTYVWHAGSGPSNHRAVRLVAPAGKAKDMGDGVLPGIASWPPKPITEHGQPKPEDDPANFEGTNIVDLCASMTYMVPTA